MYEKIPDELKQLDQWVCTWNDSKTPMSAFERKSASTSNPLTWAFFEQAEWCVQKGIYDHIGFVFADNGYVGIDIDKGFEDGFMTELGADIIAHCKSYTEYSKSKRGVHIILKGQLPFEGKNNRQGVEIYKTKRYFITTGDVLIYDSIIKNQEAIDYVLDTYFQSSKEYRFSDRIYNPVWDKSKKGAIRIRPYYPQIEAGGRNLSLTSLAGHMHTLGYSREQIRKELDYVNAECCIPPLSDGEIRNIVRSVTRYKQ